MAYFAEVDATGTVLRVISISDSDAPDPAPTNSEPIGQNYIANVLGVPGQFVQTSYNANFRKQYASPGFSYDTVADVFISPQPYPSWALDEEYDWQPPVPYPTDGASYLWDENAQSWVALS